MGIEPKFSQKDIQRFLQIKTERFERVVINHLSRIGLRFVENARNVRTYQDRTGNLRSSIGYIVMKNGVTVDENFTVAGNGSEKTRGLSKARTYVRQISIGYTTGYTLIVVAGMSYAAYVEARGKDVLTGSSLEAKQMLRKAMADIKEKVKGA